MKFPIYILLCFFLLTMSLESCEKEAVSVAAKEVVLSAEDLLALQVNQDVVFQFVTKDSGGGIHKGWILDEKGNVLTYEITDDVKWITTSNEVLTEDHLAHLYDVSIGAGRKIDAETFLERYQDLQRINAHQINDISTGDQQAPSLALYGYRYTDAATTVEGCGGGTASSQQSAINFEKLAIDVQGPAISQNPSPAARSLAKWLSDLHESL
ncbi:MAG: hypothetical protein OEQ53_16585 [Saprospiraceae bacterium]|nr:hypothetical protein [Saprospiraceae bacterium]